ncbi:MAG: hypothetical protein LHW58_01585 [Candidatus Cloacimonetes bacterium]|jgi:hypothetical protein|nr:hypothetical protein [Candidatus Cloacimonadota bacterium]MCB5254311.1 hypothetical protein [Candidatus Cloacimonadota bacterium]MCK9243515.1 hypothetical protein [Candidatus Cloacimonadota bacterium]MDD3533343.1 hypothetical protein [Candidatus Cloacimonadota bacterium]
MKHLFLTALLVLLSFSTFAQDAGEIQSINEYLESTVKYSNRLLVDSSVQSVINSEIMMAELAVNTGDKYYDRQIISSFFLKVDGSLVPFESNSLLLSSPELIKLLKDSKFKLKTEADAIAMQTLLSLVDNQKNLGYFEEEGSYYFVRDEFFDDITAYEIVTDKKARVVSIMQHLDLKKEVPESLLAAEKEEDYGTLQNTVSQADSIWTHNYLSEKANYTFSPQKLDLPLESSPALAEIYHCELKCTEIYADGTEGSSLYYFMLIHHDGKYEVFQNEEELTVSELFTESILKSMKINSEEGARAFEDLIDLLNPVDKAFRLLKKFYQQDGIWFFLRDTRFDDTYGYMVKTDEAGAIQYVEYSAITDTDILRFKMKADDFVVDYKFELVSPATNKVTVKQGEGLSVEISFDADMVNAKGCWIATRFDGHDSGFYASTSMESPFTDGLTGGALENPHHTLEYFLVKSGAEGVEDALATIRLEITVE